MAKTRKTIAIDCRMYSKKFTGIGRYINQLIINLSKIDSNNTYLLYLNKEDFNELQTPASNFKKILVNAPHYSFREQTNFLWSILKTKPDLIHFTNFNQPILNPFPQITTIHDLTLHYYPGKKFKSPIYQLVYKFILYIAVLKSKFLITISENTKKDLEKFYPRSQSKNHVIYNGVDTTFLKESSQQKPKLKLPKEYILYTGNWREHKNITNLIKAFHLLKNKYNYQGKLILTGNPNPLYPEPINYIKKHNLQEDILQLGLVEEQELPSLYKNASLYIFPSLYEGFGLPILEAYASKTPVACSNTACLPEIAKKGALYFNPSKPQDIAKTANQILSNQELQKKLIYQGQQRLKDFSFLKMATQTHHLYKRILKEQ